jgi:hypothetical protein
MTVETDNKPALLDQFGEEQWESLLAWIEEKEVIPVVGSELTTITDPKDGETKPLETWVAEELMLKLGVTASVEGGAHSERVLDQVVRAHMEAGGSARQIFPMIRNLLRENRFEPPEVVKKLARITDFNLYISTTFDSLLVDAINGERFEGAEGTDVYSYAPNKVEDIPGPRKGLERPAVYHLLGKAAAVPRYAICEEDYLEWISGLQSATYTPELLCGELQHSQLLILGLGYSNWLARFFLRMAKGHRLSEPREFGEVVAENYLTGDSGLVMFLKAFSRDTTLCGGEDGVIGFVDELYRRWEEQHGGAAEPRAAKSSRSGPARFLPPEREMPAGAVFISYSRDDIESVKRLKAGLDGAGITTWFDMDRLESGDDYRQKIENNISNCSYFVPVLSRSTAARAEGFFRREWYWACDRMMGMAEGALFILPVIVDDSLVAESRAPEAFLKMNVTGLPDGVPTEAFIERLKSLVGEGE